MFKVHENSLSSKEYTELYESVGWQVPSEAQVTLALSNSNFTVCIKDGDKAIGMGRVIGDGAMSYFIKDVAVLPAYQGKGVGTMIINSIVKHIEDTVPMGFYVSLELISSEGKEPFYEKLHFGKKPGRGMGHGMMGRVEGRRK